MFYPATAQAVPPELMARNVTIICANPAGETYTATTGWDADNTYFNGRGEIPRLFCEGGFIGEWTTYVSDDYSGAGRYYNGVEPTPTPSPTPSPSSEPMPEPSPTQPAPSPSPSETPTATVTPEPVVPTPSPEPTNTAPLPEPLPTPIPVVSNPNPTPDSEILPVPDTLPLPEPVPTPNPEPVPVPVPEPVQPEPPIEETEEPIVQVDEVDLETLAPDTPVELSNGVVVTAEIAIAIELLQDPVALLQELFTDPGAAFAALGSVGADMTDEVREESEKVIIAAVIAGNIATTASITAASAGAAYRRKP